MGVLCIILGLVILVGFSGFGYIFAGKVLGNSLYISLFGLESIAANSPSAVYAIVIGVCAFIGLLICMGLVMNGLIYNRMKQVNESLLKVNRSLKKNGKAGIEE